jgi:methylated-DNA-[protein]-cysteine S-methyltransferase
MTNALRTTTIPTPVGPFTVIAGHDGVLAAGFTPVTDRLRQLLSAGDRDRLIWPAPPSAFGAVTDAIRRYFDGDLAAIDDIPVADPASAFTAATRRELRRIPAGRPLTYRALAAAAGRPNAPRAAGAACATNPVSLFVPCHRVVRADGGLGGYLWGLPVKRSLLDHEARHAPQPTKFASREQPAGDSARALGWTGPFPQRAETPA